MRAGLLFITISDETVYPAEIKHLPDTPDIMKWPKPDFRLHEPHPVNVLLHYKL